MGGFSFGEVGSFPLGSGRIGSFSVNTIITASFLICSFIVPSELFINELKEQYNKTIQIKESLEGKANNIVTIAGTVATLLFGFGLFIIEKIGRNYEHVTLVSIVLVAGVAIIIAAMFFGIWSFRIRPYRFAMKHEIFFKDAQFNDVNVNLFKTAPAAEFYDVMIRAYLGCIKHNTKNNGIKARSIGKSQWLFLAGIITIPILIIIIVLVKLP